MFLLLLQKKNNTFALFFRSNEACSRIGSIHSRIWWYNVFRATNFIQRRTRACTRAMVSFNFNRGGSSLQWSRITWKRWLCLFEHCWWLRAFPLWLGQRHSKYYVSISPDIWNNTFFSRYKNICQILAQKSLHKFKYFLLWPSTENNSKICLLLYKLWKISWLKWRLCGVY